MISFFVLNEYKSNSPWFWLTEDRISIYDLPNKNNLRVSSEGSVFLDNAFISHRHSTVVVIISLLPFVAPYYMISNLEMTII